MLFCLYCPLVMGRIIKVSLACVCTAAFLHLWHLPDTLSRLTYMHIIYTFVQLRALLKRSAVAAWRCLDLNFWSEVQRLNH